MSDDRDRVTAILALYQAAIPENMDDPSMANIRAHVKLRDLAPSEAPWLARRLLEALDAIDKAKALHQKQIVATWSSVFSEQCGECSQSWPCPTWQALGGNESGDDR